MSGSRRLRTPGGVLAVPSAGAGEVFAVIHPCAVALYRTHPEGTPRNVWHGHVAGLNVEGPRARVAGTIPIVAGSRQRPWRICTWIKAAKFG